MCSGHFINRKNHISLNFSPPSFFVTAVKNKPPIRKYFVGDAYFQHPHNPKSCCYQYFKCKKGETCQKESTAPWHLSFHLKNILCICYTRISSDNIVPGIQAVFSFLFCFV